MRMLSVWHVVDKASRAGVIGKDAGVDKVSAFIGLIEQVRNDTLAQAVDACVNEAERHHLNMWDCRGRGDRETAELHEQRRIAVERVKDILRAMMGDQPGDRNG